ncbi:hypothetical protein [Capillimicrobium parvum]|uniref:SHOCT domain-containing protein n=1 Tax=Capillimicrobium parvum TaxID=2884022 RepID=A0A9E7C6E0_9ACTN|nr:hypothetical protein [Capillimicrobium parvum]UGS38743.1 hypothetical protein DSM104329_05173 [Capillimicrobium parvum]
MIQAIRALTGMAIGLVSVVAPSWGLYHLLRTPSCGSDGYSTFGPPCPDDVALWILGIVLSLTILAPLAIGLAGRQGTDAPVLLVPIIGLIPLGMVTGAIVSGLGPSADPDTRWIAIVGAAITALIVLRVLLGFARGAGRRRAERAERAPAVPAHELAGMAAVAATARKASAPPAVSIATLHDQLAQIADAAKQPEDGGLSVRLQRLDELRAAGSITAAEHAQRRQEILDEI